MEDMHIHLKEAVYNQSLFDIYVKKCLECHLKKVVFLDHGNRISPKHKPVLNSKEAIDALSEKINFYRTHANKLKILKGIEIDYSTDTDFRNETYRILDYGKFEWIVGAIHSMKFENEEDYYKAIIDMLDNYNINVVAHMRLDDNYKLYASIVRKILEKCNQKNVSMEINTSDRSRWNDEQLYFMLELMKQYNVNYVMGSDAHAMEEIGYMIPDVNERVKKWKKRK